MMDERDRERSRLEQRTRELFARSVADLDGETRSRLTSARGRALAELERTSLTRVWLAWRPQAAAAALALVTVGAAWLLLRGEPPVYPAAAIAEVGDFELLLDDDAFELIEELEFYAWLDEQPEFRADGDDGAG